METWSDAAGLTSQMEDKWDGIFSAALYGKRNGKTNMIVDLDVLIAVGEALLRTTNMCVFQRTLSKAIAYDKPSK